jgi:hypothetical protein
MLKVGTKFGVLETGIIGIRKLSKQDKELQIVWGEVYVPNVLDSQDDWATSEEVMGMAYGFMQKGITDHIELTASKTTRTSFMSAMARTVSSWASITINVAVCEVVGSLSIRRGPASGMFAEFH